MWCTLNINARNLRFENQLQNRSSQLYELAFADILLIFLTNIFSLLIQANQRQSKAGLDVAFLTPHAHYEGLEATKIKEVIMCIEMKNRLKHFQVR